MVSCTGQVDLIYLDINFILKPNILSPIAYLVCFIHPAYITIYQYLTAWYQKEYYEYKLSVEGELLLGLFIVDCLHAPWYFMCSKYS